MNSISTSRAEQILKTAAGRHIAVLGDFMLDRHLKGSVRRISPEAPVPVVEVESETTGLGGAGNVIQNLLTLGVVAEAFGVAGKDAAGDVMLGHMQAMGAVTSGMLLLPNRRTTEKMRIIAQDQHVVRADRESVDSISESDENTILDRLENAMSNLQGLILQDYNKGVLTTHMIEEAIRIARKRQVPVAVDPKFDHFFDYRETHLFKPNVRELERAMGLRIQNDEDLLAAGIELRSRIAPEVLMVTRGERGMTLFIGDKQIEHIPTHAKKVHDVSGAGDTVIATYVVAESGGASPVEAAIVANYAAGVVCGEVGVIPIERDRLLSEISGKV